MTPCPSRLRKLGVGILDEGLNLSDSFKEPLLVAAGAVVARELEHVHRMWPGVFWWATLGPLGTKLILYAHNNGLPSQ